MDRTNRANLIAVLAFAISCLNFIWLVYAYYDLKRDKVIVRSFFTKNGDHLNLVVNIVNSGEREIYIALLVLMFIDKEDKTIFHVALNEGENMNKPILPGAVEVYQKEIGLNSFPETIQDIVLVVSTPAKEIYREKYNVNYIRSLIEYK